MDEANGILTWLSWGVDGDDDVCDLLVLVDDDCEDDDEDSELLIK